MAKSSKQFVEGQAYPLAHVVSVLNQVVQDYPPKNPRAKKAKIEAIAACGHKFIVWSPVGTGWGASGWNPNCWRTEADEPIGSFQFHGLKN